MGYAQSPIKREYSSFCQKAKRRREGKLNKGQKSSGHADHQHAPFEPEGSRACENLKKPHYSTGRGLKCHMILPRRKVFFTGMSCWTGARSICRKGALPGSAHFPIKPLFGLIPSTFYPDSREQRADVKRMVSSSKCQQRTRFCTCTAPNIIHTTMLQASFTKQWRCTFNS